MSASVRAVVKLKPVGEREYDMSASGLDGALQAAANLRGQAKYFPGVDIEEPKPAPKKKGRKETKNGSE